MTTEVVTTVPSPRWTKVHTALLGGLIGGLAGATAAVIATEIIKWMLGLASGLHTWLLLVVPVVGVSVAVLVLHGFAKGEAVQRLLPETPRRRSRFYVFPLDLARADLTADVVATAGEEERFPWWLAPIRALAIVATVGLGAPMGTESPAAHIGVAAGSWLGGLKRLRPLVRPAAVAGGAAGVAALIGIPLVGTVFMLELGRRRDAPLSLERVLAALVGGVVGWQINVAFDLDLIRLVVPTVAPSDVPDALFAALCIGGIAGVVASMTGAAIYYFRGWTAGPVPRLLMGGLAMVLAAVAVSILATPSAAFGPGGAAIVWAETTHTTAFTLLAIALLRATMTVSAVAAGGCGGVFVPFLAIGDLTGRVFAQLFGVPSDLAGAAGAAAGIAGGYRLPFTAIMLVLGIGGPYGATLTCLATVGVATIASALSAHWFTAIAAWVTKRR